MTLVTPNDSVSMAGLQRMPHQQGQGQQPPPAKKMLDEYTAEQQRAQVVTVFMRTSEGMRFAAKVDVEGHT